MTLTAEWKARTLGGTEPALALTDPQKALDVWVRRTRAEAGKLAEDAAEGRITLKAFGDRMADLLEEGHSHATFIGRHHAGDRTPMEEDDRKFGALVVDAESEFLAGFVQDLEAGRYDGKVDAAQARAGMYASRLTGTANEAASLTADPNAEIHWHLHASESCEDCKRIAAGSPYTVETMPTWPGLCATRCLSNCACSTSGGVKAFTRTE